MTPRHPHCRTCGARIRWRRFKGWTHIDGPFAPPLHAINPDFGVLRWNYNVTVRASTLKL